MGNVLAWVYEMQQIVSQSSTIVNVEKLTYLYRKINLIGQIRTCEEELHAIFDARTCCCEKKTQSI